VPEALALRTGNRGEAVRDLQQRLADIGFRADPDESGVFGPGTERAVRAFQDDRGLPVDGVVGRYTWASLVESGFALGDRLLYYRQPMFRGDDVAELQRRLMTLGFDASRVDGIFGADTHRALVEFQRSTGLVPDGVCGPSSITALDRVGGLADGSVASVRERAALRQGPHRLEGRRVFVATPPGLAVVGDAAARGFTMARAGAVHDSSGGDASFMAQTANSLGVELVVALASATDDGPQCVYFETEGFRSETGHLVASRIRDELAVALEEPVGLTGRAYPLLRETRMAAVVCELVRDGDAAALGSLVRRSGDVARALVRGVRAAYEAAEVDAAPERDSTE
jgi:N-acetylmuramoyl-L-alanine amidase